MNETKQNIQNLNSASAKIAESLFYWIRIIACTAISSLSICNAHSSASFHLLDPVKAYNDSLFHSQNKKTPANKSFLRAAGETFGMNISLWAFDRYALKGHYAYISLNTIKENFKHGFEWDNDHLNTNMFAHPYNGSLYFNAGRSNGFNYWQSELFAIGGSAMWELFMEREHPSTNDIIATPIGGAALGEVFYRTSDRILDDRTTGSERFGRELAAFIVSPMRGVTRLITGQAWRKSSVSGREYEHSPLHLEISAGTRILSYHDKSRITKTGGSIRLNMEYGDPFDSELKIPYEYFSCLAEINLMKTQPLLSHVEIIGRLLSKELIDTKKCNLSIGLFQHFDFFDSDTISQYTPNEIEPCIVPYKLGTPASIGGGYMFRFHNNHLKLLASGHLNGVLLGGILSDYYRYYHRNYNWASGFSMKFGVKGYCLNDLLSVALNTQFYRFYTRSTLGADVDWSTTPGGKPINVEGDDSVGSFYHLEGQMNYKILQRLLLTTRFDLYRRNTHYRGGKQFLNVYASNWFLTSKQLSFQFMLTYLL